MILLQINPSYMGQYVFATLAVMGGIGGVLAIASFFATRSEVQDLKQRQSKTEELIETLRSEASTRGHRLWRRTDRLNALLQRIAGKLDVYIESDDDGEGNGE